MQFPSSRIFLCFSYENPCIVEDLWLCFAFAINHFLVLIMALVACFAETHWGQRARDLRNKQPESAYGKQVAFSAEEEEE